MPTAALDEPTLSQRVKERFHPSPAAREVDASKPDPQEAEAQAERAAKEKAEAESRTNREAEEAQRKAAEAAAKKPAAPASEEDAVFGSAPKKPEPKKPDVAKNDDAFEKELETEKKGMTEKAGTKWEELRRGKRAAEEKARAAEETAAHVREEMRVAAEANQGAKADAQAPKMEALTKELESLKAQLAEAEKTLSVTQVERSSKYRQQISEPLSELTTQAEEIAARYEVSPKTILAALKEDKATRAETLAELAADFKEGDRIDLYRIGNDMDRLNRAGEKLREKAKEDYSAIEDEERAETEREQGERRQALSASAQRAWDEAASTLAYLNPVDGAPDWNSALENAKAQISKYVPGQDAIADGRFRADAAVLPFVLKERENLNRKLAVVTEERDRLLERIKADNDADPDLSGARDSDATGGDDDGGEELTVGQRVARKFGSG